jgi:hypothetical protein
MNEKELVDVLMTDNIIKALREIGFTRSLKAIEGISNSVLRLKLRSKLYQVWGKIE